MRPFLVGFSLVIVLLASGCNGVENRNDPGTTIRIITATPRATTPPTPTSTPRVPELSPEKLADVEIEFWYLAEPYLEDPLDQLLIDFIDENQYEINVLPTRFEHPDDLDAAMVEALEREDLPDVVLAFPYQYNGWEAVGVSFLELNDYVDSTFYGLGEDQAAGIYPVFWERDNYSGIRLAFPGLFYGQTLLYNRTWAQELGFANPPLSDQQFLLQACAASAANADGTGGWMINTQPGSAAAWLLSYTGGLESEDGGYLFGLPEVTAAFEFLTELRGEDCAWQPASQFAFDSFAARRGLFYSVSTREVGAIADAFESANNRDRWDLVGLPNDQGETAISVYGRSYLIIESDLPQQIGAWLLISHLTRVESQVQLAEAAGYYPLSTAVEETLRENNVVPEAWIEGLGLLEIAVNEPRGATWRIGRGIVQDAVAEVLRPGFAPGTLAVVLDQLQVLAEELLAVE